MVVAISVQDEQFGLSEAQEHNQSTVLHVTVVGTGGPNKTEEFSESSWSQIEWWFPLIVLKMDSLFGLAEAQGHNQSTGLRRV